MPYSYTCIELVASYVCMLFLCNDLAITQIRRWNDSGGRESFRAEDYMTVTPDWAQFGHPQQGFDPEEVRWHRKNKKKDIGGC